MKITTYKFVVLLSAMLLFNSSCDDNFAEINTNPVVATSIAPGFQFTYTQLFTSGTRYENWRAALIYSSTMTQHIASLCGYWSGDKYSYNGAFSSSLFDRAYTGQVKEVQDLINTLEKGEEGDQTMLGMARIWRVVIFHRLTDLYGDIPYFEAGKGAITGIDFPKYDTQQSIYADMLNELEQGVGQLSTGGFGSADLLYGGDVDKWKKFGNSLMLRLAMRLTEVDASMAQTYVTKAIAGGIMTDNSDDAFIEHVSGPSSGPAGLNSNGLGEVLDQANGFGEGCPRLSATFVNGLMANSDPRMDIIGTPGSGGHNGLPNGLDATTILENSTGTTLAEFDQINQMLVTVSSPMMFMTSAEAQLLAAEAAMRGWASGDAASYYNQGVTNGMGQYKIFDASLDVDPAAVKAYLETNPFSMATGMAQIGWEYWVATFLNEYETFANLRRSGYPELTPINYTGNVTNGQIPKRLAYPSNEAGRESFEAAKTAQGLSDDFSTYLSAPVWWDN
ncbi:MAG: SusD/RagB family nutrient-binding outer membrane lipoprotein [Saprospiraceae bacterium]